MVVYDDTSNEPVRVYDSGVDMPDPLSFGEYKLSYRTGDVVSRHLPPAEPLYLELEDFCSAIRNGTEPRSNGEIGLEVVKMIEAVDDALLQTGVPSESVLDRHAIRESDASHDTVAGRGFRDPQVVAGGTLERVPTPAAPSV
jgi:predicted dehydrogenase